MMAMKVRFRVGSIASAAMALLIAGGAMVAMPSSALASPAYGPARGPKVLFVSPHVVAHGVGRSCFSAQFDTIGDAVASAHPGDTVVACPGTYKEDVVIQQRLTLIGLSATIDATGLPGAPIGDIAGQAPFNGITIESSHVTVQGFKVTGAEGEGILAVNPVPGAPSLTAVTIRYNDVEGNDLGNGSPDSPYIFCTPNGGGDCGEGIHLLSVADSQVTGNKSIGNSGGILLTDEFGPTHDNLIAGNDVADNVLDCGITIPSHNPGAADPVTGQPHPTVAGVYRNKVIANVVTGNGVEGFGAGIGVFAPAPGTASYDNLVSGNYIQGNGLAGISVHSHAPNADVDGNAFVGNIIGTNNLSGADGADVSPKDTQTTGILIWSAVSTYHFTVSHNLILNNTYGVWFTPATIAVSGLGSNRFVHVATPILQAS
jgi:nitrous oxidase accessory protein NosD